MQKNDGLSMYQQIALDLAQRIVTGEIQSEQKLHGRSTLSSMYNVSAETIRRAVALLQEMHVVTVTPGSGIIVVSAKNACNFVERFHSLQSVGSLKQTVSDLLEEKAEIEKTLVQTIDQLIAYSDRLKNLSPYNPIEIKIQPGSWVIGHNIAELRFWQETGGTIVALRRGDHSIISPGPFALFEEDDVVVVVGEEGIFSEVEKYLNRLDPKDKQPPSASACPEYKRI